LHTLGSVFGLAQNDRLLGVDIRALFIYGGNFLLSLGGDGLGIFLAIGF